MSPAKKAGSSTARAERPRTSATFSDAERAAMRERARELKAEGGKGDGEAALLAKIAEMPEPDRSMATRLHALITKLAPSLAPRTWYGMPAYARDGKVLCFFQSGSKFKTRYATFGFSDAAALDEGNMWPTAFALTALTPEVEKRIVELVKRAAG
jgi:uncharacterized protein YdhG (YjbR/CyaY superfamily)